MTITYVFALTLVTYSSTNHALSNSNSLLSGAESKDDLSACPAESRRGFGQLLLLPVQSKFMLNKVTEIRRDRKT